MEVSTISADAVFRSCFCACPADLKPLLLDVRDNKLFARGHIAGAYSIRKPASGSVLLDYSKNEYDAKWSADCWWSRDVIVYGDATLKKDHPVIALLAADKHARSLSLMREGLEAFQRRYPALVTTSVRPGAVHRYPSQVEVGADSTAAARWPGLYLGDWEDAEALERHRELGVTAVVTIHNNPASLRLPAARYRHLQIELPDVDTADIGAHLAAAYEFIQDCAAQKRGVLVHCGAGVSRSATLVVAYLMRKHRWSAQAALAATKQRRSVVAPNGGFWRALCRLEEELGLAERSDVDAFSGLHGADAPQQQEVAPPPAAAAAQAGAAPAAAPAAVLARVTFVPAGATSAPAGSMAQTAAPPQAAAPGGGGGREGRRERSRSRDRQRRRSRSSSRDRHRRRRSHSRSTSPGRRRQQPAEEEEERVSLSGTPGAAVLEVVREGQQLGHLVIELQRHQECVFGRLPSCGVPLDHLSISRQHARLTTDATGALFLTDLGSGHGTNLDEMWVKARVPKELRRGSVFKLGASTRQYRVVQLPRA